MIDMSLCLILLALQHSQNFQRLTYVLVSEVLRLVITQVSSSQDSITILSHSRHCLNKYLRNLKGSQHRITQSGISTIRFILDCVMRPDLGPRGTPRLLCHSSTKLRLVASLRLRLLLRDFIRLSTYPCLIVYANLARSGMSSFFEQNFLFWFGWRVETYFT